MGRPQEATHTIGVAPLDEQESSSSAGRVRPILARSPPTATTSKDGHDPFYGLQRTQSEAPRAPSSTRPSGPSTYDADVSVSFHHRLAPLASRLACTVIV